jgi:hypothetical protein
MTDELIGVWTVRDDAGQPVRSGPIVASEEDPLTSLVLPDVEGNVPTLNRSWSLELDWQSRRGWLTGS